MTDTQTIIQLTAKNFDEWFKVATLEHNIDGKYLVLTDYENSIEIDTTIEGGWVIDSPFPLQQYQAERLFEALDDFLRPCDEEGEPAIEKNGIYSSTY